MEQVFTLRTVEGEFAFCLCLGLLISLSFEGRAQSFDLGFHQVDKELTSFFEQCL